jgi:hypothetical protein
MEKRVFHLQPAEREKLSKLVRNGKIPRLNLLGDGARWIAKFFTERLAAWPGTELILD